VCLDGTSIGNDQGIFVVHSSDIREIYTFQTLNDNKIALLEFVKTLETHGQYFKSFTDNIEQERLAQDFLKNALRPYIR
jgi:hypothetical protein